ncbi:putative transmembrane protein [Anaeromyxobacter sp. K]|uniref:DUF4126 domain-containing protein n=1 Tax=Anaeromyxobacter sp. (strain K) TaxID=447217 RepID=UPI00015F9D4E|nr:DUF4126 domain-containing protein [Anaeromyxobacter sp. K]ACG72265.1 putative transmembrane protein [Anaeromyxobacter sp. K]
MEPLTALAQSLGLAFASGISAYAAAAFVGLAGHLGWIGPLPGALGLLTDPWVFGTAGALALVEALAMLVPGIATAWEAIHTAIRPFAAAALAVLATWGEPRLAVVAALLGGALGLATHATKLGLRATIDTSPEPVTNAAATTGELGVVAALAWAIWAHPWIALAAALALLTALLYVVRALWRTVARAIAALFSPPTAPGS